MKPLLKNILISVLFLLSFPIAQLEISLRFVWPIVIALLFIFTTKRVLFGLLMGGLTGTLLLKHNEPWLLLSSFFGDHLIPSLNNQWNICVILFTLLMGGFIALIEKSGGLQLLASLFLRHSQNLQKRVQLTTFALGFICFIDGLANSILVGRVMRPLADQNGISRERLAYIVDSTSSPIACLAFISTWIAYQLSLINETAIQLHSNAYHIFFSSLPYNFYCWFTLILLVTVILKNWSIGPLQKIETKYKPSSSPSNEAALSLPSSQQSHFSILFRTFFPLLFFIIGLPLFLFLDGASSFSFLTIDSIIDAFGNANQAKILVITVSLSALLAFFLIPKSPEKSSAETVFMEGVIRLFPPILVLIGAWTLSSTLTALGTKDFLAALVHSNFSPHWFPATVFLVGAITSFSTGTSWGTMGVLMPLSLPIALGFGTSLPETELLVLISGTIGAVFSGAVFGDHCSPFSDTTLVSAAACECDPFSHVKTQLPYAVLSGICALFFGFLPAFSGVPIWILFPISFALLWFLPNIHRIFSK